MKVNSFVPDLPLAEKKVLANRLISKWASFDSRAMGLLTEPVDEKRVDDILEMHYILSCLYHPESNGNLRYRWMSLQHKGELAPTPLDIALSGPKGFERVRRALAAQMSR